MLSAARSFVLAKNDFTNGQAERCGGGDCGVALGGSCRVGRNYKVCQAWLARGSFFVGLCPAVRRFIMLGETIASVLSQRIC